MSAKVPRLKQFLSALSVRSLQLFHEVPREVQTQKAVDVKTGSAECPGEQRVVGHKFGDDMTDVALPRIPYASQYLQHDLRVEIANFHPSILPRSSRCRDVDEEEESEEEPVLRRGHHAVVHQGR